MIHVSCMLAFSVLVALPSAHALDVDKAQKAASELAAKHAGIPKLIESLKAKIKAKKYAEFDAEFNAKIEDASRPKICGQLEEEGNALGSIVDAICADHEDECKKKTITIEGKTYTLRENFDESNDEVKARYVTNKLTQWSSSASCSDLFAPIGELRTAHMDDIHKLKVSGAKSAIGDLLKKWSSQKGKKFDVLADARNSGWYHGVLDSVYDSNADASSKYSDATAVDVRACFKMEGWEMLGEHCVSASDENIQPRGSKTAGKASTGPSPEASKKIKEILAREKATVAAGGKTCAKHNGKIKACYEASNDGCVWRADAAGGHCNFQLKTGGWGDLVPFN